LPLPSGAIVLLSILCALMIGWAMRGDARR
jgi:hypothetical protein